MTEIHTMNANPLTAGGGAIWHWEIAVYLFLGGLTAGLMIVAGILARRVPTDKQSSIARALPLAAPAVLTLGMLALLLDLAYKAHFWRFYLAFEWTSPMSWGAWILLLIYPATIVYGLGRLDAAEVDGMSDNCVLRAVGLPALLGWLGRLGRAHLVGLGWANIALGVVLGGYTGVLLATLNARPLWNTTLLGPLFIVSGLCAGAELTLLLKVTDEERRVVRGWGLGALVAELVLLALFVLGLATGPEGARQAARLLLGGELTAVFWSVVVIAGLLIPLLLNVLEARRHLPRTVYAPLLMLIGGLSLRWVLVVAGQL